MEIKERLTEFKKQLEHENVGKTRSLEGYKKRILELEKELNDVNSELKQLDVILKGLNK